MGRGDSSPPRHRCLLKTVLTCVCERERGGGSLITPWVGGGGGDSGAPRPFPRSGPRGRQDWSWARQAERAVPNLFITALTWSVGAGQGPGASNGESPSQSLPVWRVPWSPLSRSPFLDFFPPPDAIHPLISRWVPDQPPPRPLGSRAPTPAAPSLTLS